MTDTVDALTNWASRNGVSLENVDFQEGDHGIGLYARRQIRGPRDSALSIPKSLILSTAVVKAEQNVRLQGLLEALPAWRREARGSIMIYLACLHMGLLENSWTAYLNLLQDVSLPTTWNEGQVETLRGTTLELPLAHKLARLRREFKDFTIALDGAHEQIDNIAVSHSEKPLKNALNFDSWRRLDALYRSRVLELPSHGDCLVPCIDMANHSRQQATAEFRETLDGVALVLYDGKAVLPAQEIFISYGDHKSSYEMLFTYGFVEECELSKEEVYINLEAMEDDPLKLPKESLASDRRARFYYENHNPGSSPSVQWDSVFAWLACINEEDGLKIILGPDHNTLQLYWQDVIMDEAMLRDKLRDDPRVDVFTLRAVTLIGEQLSTCLMHLTAAEEHLSDTQVLETYGSRHHHIISTLRGLDRTLLEAADQALRQQQTVLVETSAVREYLGIGIHTI